jgi:hypothetical protein
MSENIYWIVPQKVLYFAPVAHATTEKVIEDNQTLERYLDETSATVHLIIDSRQLKRIPISLARVRQMNTFFERKNLGWIVVIEGDTFAKFITRILANLMPHRIKFVADMSAAERYLTTIDHTINWDKKQIADS